MIPLDRFEKWSARLDECSRKFLNEAEYQEYLSIPAPVKLRQLKAILEKPIARFTPVNEAFFRAKWADVLSAADPGNGLALLEVASGDADMIPQMLARARPHSRYIAANMNRVLTERLRERTRDLPLEIVVIEEDAAKIEHYLPAESVDIVAFQHGVNDVIQAILCDQAGVDTVYSDWMDTLPEMITILRRETAQNTLEQNAKPAFLSLLERLFRVLKTGGVMVMSHYMFQLDLDWGYPPVLWEDLLPITREWIRELPGCKEGSFEGFEPHWWIFYQKVQGADRA
jgi:SAM-dependent methyltransferase